MFSLLKQLRKRTTDSLNTLPDRELQSGIAEIVKYGLIRDSDLFEWLEENMDKILARDPAATRFAVSECAGAQ